MVPALVWKSKGPAPSGVARGGYPVQSVEGERVEVVARAPLGDPIEIRFGNSRLSLRKAEAAFVAVQIR